MTSSNFAQVACFVAPHKDLIMTSSNPTVRHLATMSFVENQFGRPEIPSEQLTIDLVPKVGLSYYPDVVEFALTFDGYENYSNRLAKIGADGLAKYNETGKLPRSLDRLRACLFFQQRYWRANECDPDEPAMQFINALLDAIRAKVSK